MDLSTTTPAVAVEDVDARVVDDDHCVCGRSLLDGQGYDGLCGDCADRADAATDDCVECGVPLRSDQEHLDGACASCARAGRSEP